MRDIFDLGDALLLVASDRISAFDVIIPNGIPRKGEVLTHISHFWFEKFASLVPNHPLARADDPLPKNLQPFADKLARRSMIVKKAKPLASIEFPVAVALPNDVHFVTSNFAVNIQQLQFPEAGLYSVDIRLDGKSQASIPLPVKLRPHMAV